MKILVTGGAGYIGSVLVGHLLEQGADVTAVDNLMYRQTSLLHYFANPRFSFVRGDVRDERLIKQLLPGKDFILLLAAIVGAPACERDRDTSTAINLHAIEMINRMRSRQQAIIFPTTNSGYGTTNGKTPCTEKTRLAPISLYGKNKAEAEKILLDTGNVITLRLATVFGLSPRMRLDLLVNDFTYRAVTDGYLVIFEKHFKRNFLHILDVAGCFSYCIEHFQKMKDEPYNIGMNEANLSKEELALKIKQYLPGTYLHFAEIGSDPDKRNYIVSNNKINIKGFHAVHSLDEGIQQLIKGYQMIGKTEMYNY
jgi:nucleoside-diphosphate-sugar epimerase